ncbi:hypothetical protein IE077_002129, partial [Cardiosporidium cionae]
FCDEPVAVVGTVSQSYQSFHELGELHPIRFIQLAIITTPGMSGAPVCDVKGHVIAIILKKFQEYGLALPISLVLNVVKNLETHGSWKPPLLGFQLANSSMPSFPTKNLMETAELTESPHSALTQTLGVDVISVLADTPASRAGIRPGDKIISLNGSSVYTVFDVLENIVNFKEASFELKLLREVVQDYPVKMFP